MTHQPETPRGRLLEILGWARPHDSECERRFCKEFLDTVPGMNKDSFGNRYIRISDKPNVMWSCHVDTVCHQALAGPQIIAFDPATGIASLATEVKKTSLGADDGVGVWLMLEMIAAKRPGLYVFHRGEEVGCLGSGHARLHSRHLFEGIEAAVAFDRAGYRDVITHQAYGRTCSDAFAQSFADQLNAFSAEFEFRPDDTGVYTDTNEYAGIVPECSNLSVGYHGQHGPSETQDVYFAETLLRAMLAFDTDLLLIERDPTVVEYENYVQQGGGWHRIETDFDEILEIVREFPEAAASILMGRGITPEALWNEVIDFDDASGIDADRDVPPWMN